MSSRRLVAGESLAESALETANGGFFVPTRIEMGLHYARCGRAVVGYCHRRNNVAIQQDGAPEIAYRDATSVLYHNHARAIINS